MTTYIAMKWMAFEHHRLTLSQSFTVFPFRPRTVFSEAISPARHLSYWHRPYTATKNLPMLFLHSVDVGLTTYTKFFRNFIDNETKEDGQMGIIALEIMSIAMCMTTPSLHRDEILREILRILDHHGWGKCVIVGVSYGTVVATHLQRYLETKDRVGPIVLIDPVTLSIHVGEIPYNFIYRQPRTASEWQLQHFVSTDVGSNHAEVRVAFSATRNILNREMITVS